MSDFLTFKLSDDFVEGYANKPINWGFPITDDFFLGEFIFLSKYSRKKADGTKERWHETCRRVVEGAFTIQKNHCQHRRTPWNDHKAQRAARDMFDRMFHFKWLPPGRGIQHMGCAIVHEENNSAALQNCAFLSTGKISTHSVNAAVGPFVRMMEMSMYGVGVGFDTKGAGKLTIHAPSSEKDVEIFVVPDTREGWAEAVGKLLESYFFQNKARVEFDYSEIRPAGAPLVRFGGTASGPGPLRAAIDKIRQLLDASVGEAITSRNIVDIMNLIGKAVQSGGARRSAQIALGDPDDKDFIGIKDFGIEANNERLGEDGWGFGSNNSIFAEPGVDYSDIIDHVSTNGEPGLFWLDIARGYGRLADPRNDRDCRVVGTNPCAEQSLEDAELCCLVEVFPYNHESREDFLETLKVAYLYGKSVTLLPTCWPETNEVMARNHRIGCSLSGLAQFIEDRGWSELRSWMDEGYQTIQRRDRKYSEWLGVRESIKTTSIKPSGTVSLLAGATPGVHWPTSAGTYIRRVKCSKTDPMAQVLIEAGYHVEPDRNDPESTLIIQFVVDGPQVRSEREVTLWEKAELVTTAQRFWADNQVSATLTFLEDERDQVGPLLRSKDGQFKAISFLPLYAEGEPYPQQPYQRISAEDAASYRAGLQPVDLELVYQQGMDVQDERGCTNDRCVI